MKAHTIAAGPARTWKPSERAIFAVNGDKSGTGPVEVIINGYIGEDLWDDSGMSERKFLAALEGYENSRDLHVIINSMGGSVKEGLGIYNAIKRWPGKTTARISGFAVSIASVIPLACDRVISPKSSNWMIHDPLCMTGGNADDHRKSIEMLESCAATMAAIYAEKTGKTRKQMRDVMKAETWYTGEEAKAEGLSDEVNDDAIEPKAAFRIALGAAEEPPENLVTELLEQFRNTPQRLVAALKPPTTTPPPTAAGQPNGSTMQKDKIIALLKQHGKTVAADATDEQLLAALTELVTAGKVTKKDADALKTDEGKVLIDAKELRDMHARLTEERNTRIRNEFKALAQDRGFLDENVWLPKLYADESLMEVVRALPVMIGTTPVTATRVENLGNQLIEKYDAMEPGKERAAFASKHWNELKAAKQRFQDQQFESLTPAQQMRLLRSGPQAANTYSATLVTDHVANAVITTIGVKLAPLNAFSRRYEVDRLKPKATVDVEKVTVASTTLTDATDFEQSDTTNETVQVTVNQYTQPWNLTNAERNSGHALMNKAEKNAQGLANKLSDIWTAKITTANFGTAISIGAAAAFDADGLPPIYAAAKNYGKKNLILDGGHLAYLLPRNKEQFRLGEEGAYNFDLIAEQNRWTGATANTVGFICDPNAIAIAAGRPMAFDDRLYMGVTEVTLEPLGIVITVAHWFSTKTRAEHMSYDIMFGAKEGDTTAGELLST